MNDRYNDKCLVCDKRQANMCTPCHDRETKKACAAESRKCLSQAAVAHEYEVREARADESAAFSGKGRCEKGWWHCADCDNTKAPHKDKICRGCLNMSDVAAYDTGYRKGQADLIEKGWTILQTYNGTALWHSKHFLLMLKKVSESAELDKSIKAVGSDSETLAKRNSQRVGEHSGSNSAPEKQCEGKCNCPDCDMMQGIEHEETKPEKPRCCACFKTECEHQPTYQQKPKKHKHRWIAETALNTPFCMLCGKDKPSKELTKD